jgi:hypothetical protein
MYDITNVVAYGTAGETLYTVATWNMGVTKKRHPARRPKYHVSPIGCTGKMKLQS